MTGLVIDKRYLNHTMGSYHIEGPQRLEVLLRLVESADKRAWRMIEPRPATEEELCRVHERSYVDFVKATAGREWTFLDPDTGACALTYETALLAAGGVLAAADAVLDGRVRNAFALVRPPGHHAEPARAMGFCFFNNVAVAAAHLLAARGLQRVLVVDFDVHHGNGTQAAFYERDDVLYVSTHQVPFYPGSGRASETGAGRGRGYTLNIPLLAGKGDGDFLFIFRELLAPVAARYRPEFILVSAGFDIAVEDPLGGMEVTAEGFGDLAAELVKMADESAGGKVAFVLEGGYSLQALGAGVGEVLRRLGGEKGRREVPPEPLSTLRREIEPSFQAAREHGPL
jgi:acetoin utilization deacetylase AcuC-like enzyme